MNLKLGSFFHTLNTNSHMFESKLDNLVNTIITFSLLSILTLGKYRVYKKDEVNRKSDLLKVKSVVYLDLKGMLLRCLIMFLISWAIISGAIYAVTQEIINIVVNIVG